MIEHFSNAMDAVNAVVWGPVMVILLVGTGLYLSIRLGFIQFRRLRHSVACISGKYDDPNEKGEITHFQALCAALSATIGTGNIAGVATAIALGGPGAVFWMWVTALVGMATKYTSCSLAVRYRVIHADGSASGGPMYYLDKGLNAKWLGVIFALCAGIGSFGMGCAVQANSVTDGLLDLFPEAWRGSTMMHIPLIGDTMKIKPVIGLALAFMVGIVTIGGIKRIGKVASKIVPFMSVLYVCTALIILAINAGAIPQAFAQIFRYAFTPMAVGGGFFGVVVSRTIQKGVARGVFSNESGLGSAPMAHAAARTSEMSREGFVAMLGPFIDTIIVCTMTALVIITSGVWQVKDSQGRTLYGPGGKGVPTKVIINDKPVQVIGSATEEGKVFRDDSGEYYKLPTGASLTADAFEKAVPGFGRALVSISLVFFAYSTMISWSYYGDRCWEYLLGAKVVTPYRYLFCVSVATGAVVSLDLVWTVADNLNAFMAVPNLVGLIGLAGIVVRDTKVYLKRMGEDVKG